jgi:serine/threonine-protein kinase
LASEEALKFVDELLDVLVAAHAQGILHRDIKPENLFLTTSGELKVLDFGIAQFAERALASFRTESGTLLGTPAFMSPEQASGNFDELDERTDIWSVGATLFALLSSEFVHPAPNGNQQVALAMTRPARSLASAAPELPRALVAVVDRALRFSPAERWQDAKTMQWAVRILRANWTSIVSAPERIPGELSTLVDGEGSKRTTLASGSPSGFSRKSDPGYRSRPFWFLGGGAALLAFIAFASSRRPSIDSAPSAVTPQETTSLKSSPAPFGPAPPAAVIVENSAESESRAPANGASEPSADMRQKPKSRRATTPAPSVSASSSQAAAPPRLELDTELMNHRH